MYFVSVLYNLYEYDFFSKIFGEADTNIKLKIYDVALNNYPADINECDGYIITGSKLSVYDDEKWIRDLETQLKGARNSLQISEDMLKECQKK